MLVAVVALALGDTFCDNVNNFAPVRACSEYTALTTSAACNAAWPATLPNVTFTARSFDDYNLCEGVCPAATVDACFETMSAFTNGLTLQAAFTMGYVSIADTQIFIVFMQQAVDGCTAEEFTTADLLEACNGGWRSHHGIEPGAGRRRQAEPVRFNNKFETGTLDEVADTASDVIMYVSLGLGACAIAGFAVYLYNRMAGGKTGDGLSSLL